MTDLVVVSEKCPFNRECWGTIPQCDDDYESCPIYKEKLAQKREVG